MVVDETPRRGAALIVVLVFAALISSLTAVALRSAVSGAAASVVFVDEMRANEMGRAAADLVAYQLRFGGPEAKRGGALTARLATCEVTVEYLSEAARIDVNTASPKLIAALFLAAGAEPDDVAAIANRIQLTRRPAVASRIAPSSAAGNEILPNAIMVRLEQIMDAWQIPEALFRSVRPALTVSNRSGNVDPTLAGRLVLTALMNGDAERADQFMERRNSGFTTPNQVLAQFPVETRSFVNASGLAPVRAFARVNVAGRFARSYEFVVAPPSGAFKTTRVLSWQPR